MKKLCYSTVSTCIHLFWYPFVFCPLEFRNSIRANWLKLKVFISLHYSMKMYNALIYFRILVKFKQRWEIKDKWWQNCFFYSQLFEKHVSLHIDTVWTSLYTIVLQSGAPCLLGIKWQMQSVVMMSLNDITCKGRQGHCLLALDVSRMKPSCLDLLTCCLWLSVLMFICNQFSPSDYYECAHQWGYALTSCLSEVVVECVVRSLLYSKTKFKAADPVFSVHWHLVDPDGWTHMPY